ncbi:MAG: hypothetical protein WBG50_26785, partial [Desulfomonilaceae bacterium]
KGNRDSPALRFGVIFQTTYPTAVPEHGGIHIESIRPAKLDRSSIWRTSRLVQDIARGVSPPPVA